VVSPEDTLLSAGGGVALTLAEKAGSRTLLNDLGKVAPIRHGTAAVTSAGNLPVHYVFHAAALEIDVDGEYHVDAPKVEAAMADVLMQADALGVSRLLVPLLGAGVGGLSPAESLLAIMSAAVAQPAARVARTLTVVIFDESVLPHGEIRAAIDNAVVSGTQA
jgi:O-acetyl-ADP-ribose deacetylase (regulator of RNase III)